MYKHLFIARHGSYDRYRGGDLSSEGKKEIERLACAILEITQDCDIYVVSSRLKRAVQSCDILMEKCKVCGSDISDELSIEDEFLPKGHERAINQLIFGREKSVEAIVLMTHVAIADDYSSIFLAQNLNRRKQIIINRGQAFYFDFVSLEWRVIP